MLNRKATTWFQRAGAVLGLGLAGFVGCSSERASEPESAGAISQAATLVESGFTDTLVVSGLSNPTAMAFAPDGRLFVAQQGGQLRVVKSGALLPTPFLSVSVDSNGERGLLGVTFDPSFAANQYIYVYYTTTSGGTHNRLSRFTASGDVALAGSETVLVDFPGLSAATNHNGGALHFGNDGKLYVAVGENANGSNAQSMTTPLGKLLRFNRDGSIPSDNPFFASTTGLSRAIWALGLRNPFTFDVRRSTGAILINDVGQTSWEEVNLGGAGRNYGWPSTEGATTNASFVGPVFTYPHGQGNSSGCAITGGAFYDPVTAQFPASYVGKYFFADYCNGWMRTLDPATGAATVFATGLNAVVDIRVGPEGALYYLARGAGAIGKISFSTSQSPSVATQPSSVTVPVGSTATFTVSASGSSPLAYQWQRNASNISGATGASYSLSNVQASDSGAQFRAVVSNAFGSATSNAAVLTVTSNTAPTVSITAPAVGATYTGGSTLSFAATATDAEDGALPASAFTWRIDLHHDEHVHPAMPDTSGIKSGTWPVPNSGHTETTVLYSVVLTVKDSSGLTTSKSVDVVPIVKQITLDTVPAGLSVTLDDQPFTAPLAADSVVGVLRSIGVASPQTLGGKVYTFSGWSDSGAATHSITTPAANTTYTATFTESAASVVPPGGGTVSGTTSGASAASGTCAAATSSAPERVLTWTPSASGTAKLTTCGATTFDTVLYVRGGSQSGAQLTCNDDTAGCGTNDGSVNRSGHGSVVNFSVVAGTTYYIYVDGFAGSTGGSSGSFVLNVTAPVAAPPPDVLPSSGGTVTGTTSGTSLYSGACASAATAAAPDHAYSWVAPRSGTAKFTTCGTSSGGFDTVLYVGATLGASALGCNDDTANCGVADGSANQAKHGSVVSVNVVAGQTYYVHVDGFAGSSGPSVGNYTLNVTPPP